ncbi:MAG: alkaline phosphatase [Candidatus Hydrogenedentes bacterium]|nr:alkaline phosphatase [Candidatus Hydrogenedentota bacterium]
MRAVLSTLFVLGMTLALGTPSSAQVSGVDHVVVIGVDGMGPAGIEGADTPNMDGLAAEGAHSFKARGVMPTSSAPNWASMIMGAGPEQHGVTSNDWTPFKYEIEPLEKGPGQIFPTMFSLVHEQKPDAWQAVIHHWKGFGFLFERKLVNQIENGETQQDTTARAVKCIQDHRPYLLFVHLDHVDAALHGAGWLTPEYFAAVAEADKLIGEIIGALKETGIYDSTLVIVTADHGGKDRGHGGATTQEIEIPWIIHGPGVRSGVELEEPINTYDTAATVAYVLGLKTPNVWTGKPVLEAFTK